MSYITRHAFAEEGSICEVPPKRKEEFLSPLLIPLGVRERRCEWARRPHGGLAAHPLRLELLDLLISGFGADGLGKVYVCLLSYLTLYIHIYKYIYIYILSLHYFNLI